METKKDYVRVRLRDGTVVRVEYEDGKTGLLIRSYHEVLGAFGNHGLERGCSGARKRHLALEYSESHYGPVDSVIEESFE
ncbi:MAG: hypothetical protein HYX24_07495 [Candidatus Aenigmarchaeota archaeon]|nr:hypothetical protein [Candidatus Aenigmarchaeota archaeon]